MCFTCILLTVCMFVCIGATALSGAYYGIGTGPIHMDDVICTGDEQNLTSCSFTSNEMFCTHANDAGVRYSFLYTHVLFCTCIQFCNNVDHNHIY